MIKCYEERDCYCCGLELNAEPYKCSNIDHWEKFSQLLINENGNLQSENFKLNEKLALSNNDRDLLDVAEWLENLERTKKYNCRMCNRDYEVPIHLTHFTCVCGLRCRMRHVGGNDPYQSVIDAAIDYFGTERMAQLAYLAEIIGGKHCEHYNANEIRNIIRNELNRWEIVDNKWKFKK